MPTPPVDFSHLSPAERLDLIGELWDSLDPTQAPELTPEIAAELDRRLAEAEQDPRAGRTWDEVRADLRRRIE
jgi:putative addiction module component (TIGR02574 family)